GPIEITVIHASELTPADRRGWSALQASNPSLASPYFTVEFVALVAAVRDDVWVGVLREGERVVGFFPFQTRDDREGDPLAHQASDFHGVVAAPGTQWDAERLVQACGLRAWAFHHLPVAQAPFRAYHEETFPSPYLDLSRGYEDYAQQRREAGTRQV